MTTTEQVRMLRELLVEAQEHLAQCAHHHRDDFVLEGYNNENHGPGILPRIIKALAATSDEVVK